MNPTHTFIFCFSKSNFNIIIPYISRSRLWFVLIFDMHSTHSTFLFSLVICTHIFTMHSTHPTILISLKFITSTIIRWRLFWGLSSDFLQTTTSSRGLGKVPANTAAWKSPMCRPRPKHTECYTLLLVFLDWIPIFWPEGYGSNSANMYRMDDSMDASINNTNWFITLILNR